MVCTSTLLKSLVNDVATILTTVLVTVLVRVVASKGLKKGQLNLKVNVGEVSNRRLGFLGPPNESPTCLYTNLSSKEGEHRYDIINTGSSFLKCVSSV